MRIHQMQKLSRRVSATSQGPDAGDIHPGLHRMCLDQGAQPVEVDGRIKNKTISVLEGEHPYKITAGRIERVSTAAGMLPGIFRAGLPFEKILRSFSRVCTVPFSFVGQLQLDKNYRFIGKDDKEIMESQSTFQALVEESAQYHYVREKEFDRLKWPKGEDPDGRPADDVRPLTQQRSLLVACPVRLRGMYDSITTAAKARSKEKGEAKAAAAKQKRAFEDLQKMTAMSETRGSLLKKEKANRIVATKKLKKTSEELKTSKKEIAALRKQLADITKQNLKLSAATLVRQNTLA